MELSYRPFKQPIPRSHFALSESGLVVYERDDTLGKGHTAPENAHRKFAAVKSAEDAVAFLNKYGPLGFDDTSHTDEHGNEVFGEHVEDILESAKQFAQFCRELDHRKKIHDDAIKSAVMKSKTVRDHHTSKTRRTIAETAAIHKKTVKLCNLYNEHSLVRFPVKLSPLGAESPEGGRTPGKIKKADKVSFEFKFHTLLQWMNYCVALEISGDIVHFVCENENCKEEQTYFKGVGKPAKTCPLGKGKDPKIDCGTTYQNQRRSPKFKRSKRKG